MTVAQRGGRVGATATLLDVRLLAVTGRSHLAPTSADELEVRVDQAAGIQRVDDRRLVVLATTDVAVHAVSDGNPLVWECRLELALAYEVAGLAERTDDELQAFAVTSGALAANPFFREHVRDLAGRSGLPPILLPMVRLDLEILD